MEAVVATYRNGVLTPSRPLDLAEGSQVKLWIDPSADVRHEMTADDREFFKMLLHDRDAVFRALAK